MHPLASNSPLLLAWVAAAALVAPLSADAASTCLVGGFTLQDRRDLAALRTAAESACPCTSFTKRGPYRSCAKDVIDAALLAGDLRSDCKREARKALTSATCGGDKVACGRVKLADESFSCRVSRDTACSDNSRFQRTECAEQTHCADVVDWTAGTCFDVRDLGPYAPGYRSITYTKDSVFQPGNPRVLATSIWYPAPAGSAPINGSTGGVADAPLDGSGGPYPIVLFSHGSCGYPLQSIFMLPRLASHGFIVIAPPHPGNTISDFPNCASGSAQAASAVERPNDMIYVLDQMIAADLDLGSPFFGAVDETRVAMTGHSFGGLTTYLVAAMEPRITAAIPMAPATSSSSELEIPSLLMLGNVDSVVNNASARAAYERSATPKLLVEVEHAGHYAFSNLCFAGNDCNPPVTLTQPESHALVLRYVLPFLKVHLEGNTDWAPLLGPPAQPGFLYTAEE